MFFCSTKFNLSKNKKAVKSFDYYNFDESIVVLINNNTILLYNKYYLNENSLTKFKMIQKINPYEFKLKENIITKYNREF